MSRRTRVRGAILLALSSLFLVQAALLALPAPVQAATRKTPTTLVIGATDVPAGSSASVTVQGPNGFRRTYTRAGSTRIANAPAGRYTITTKPIVVATATAGAVAGTYYPTVPTTKTLRTGGTLRLRADFETVVAPRVTVTDATTIAATSIAAGSKPGTAGTVQVRGTFATGDLLVSGVTPTTPEGLLVRLGAQRTVSNGVTTFAATTVPLTTVLLRGSFGQTVTGSATLDGTSPGSLSAVDATITPGAFTMSSPFRTTVPCSSKASMGLEAKVDATITAGITARWDVLHPAATAVGVAAVAHAIGTMNTWVTGAAACSGTKSKLGRSVPLGTVVVDVGPVPVVLVQSLQFVAEGSAGTEAPMAASVVTDVTTTAGLTATTHGRTSTVQLPVLNAKAGPPWATGSGAATLVIGAKLHSKLYGIDGAYASVKVGPNITANRSSAPWWKVDAHITAGIGVHIAALGIQQGRSALLDHSWPISEAVGAIGD